MSDIVKFPHKNILAWAALEALADGEEHPIHEIRSRVAAELRITRAALARQYKGKARANAFNVRMNDILRHMKNEGTIVNTRRGFFQLTLENKHPPRTEAGVNARIPDRPMGREAYRKWLISELARVEGLL